MARRNDSADKEILVSRSAANEIFREAIRLFVGRGRRFSVKQVQIGTGISDRMIESFMAPVHSNEFRKPDLEEVLTLASFFGSDFTSQLILTFGQAAFDLPDDGDLPPGDIAADNAEDNALITRAAKDGVFDPEERKQLRPVGLRMVSRGQRLAALAA